MGLLSTLFLLVLEILIAATIWNYYENRTSPRTEKYLTFAPRFWTGWVDGCVLWPVGFCTTLLFKVVHGPSGAVAIVVGKNLVVLFYTVIMHARLGQTVGKIGCKVRVVDAATEGRISFFQALIREGIPIALNLGFAAYATALFFSTSASQQADPGVMIAKLSSMALLGSVPALWFLVEVVTMFTNEKRRALHDYIAGTVVIRTNIDPEHA